MRKYVFIITLLILISGSFAQDINIRINRITANSTLEDARNRYCSNNLIDYKNNTSWAEGNQDDQGTITIDFKHKVTINYIYIKNGYADPKYYYKNNRAKNIKIFYDTNGWSDYILTDNPGFQKISFSMPIKTNSIRIEIIDTYPGTHYNDTCISKISFDTPNNEIILKQNCNWFNLYSKTINDLIYKELIKNRKYQNYEREYILDGYPQDTINDFSDIEILNTDDGKIYFFVKTNIERKSYNDHRDLFLSIFEFDETHVWMNQRIIPYIQKNDIDKLLKANKTFSDKYSSDLQIEYLNINKSIKNNTCILFNILSCRAFENIIEYQVYDYNHSNFYFYFPKTIINTTVSRIAEVNYK